MNPLFDAMQRIWIHRAVDLFVGVVSPLLFMGRDEKNQEFDTRLLEAQLWNFVFKTARSRNEENAWDNAVIEVFGHHNWDLLPVTEVDPVDPGWLKVDAIMDEYYANRNRREEKEEKELRKL